MCEFKRQHISVVNYSLPPHTNETENLRPWSSTPTSYSKGRARCQHCRFVLSLQPIESRVRQRCFLQHLHKKVKWSRYRPGVAKSVGRNIDLLFHGRGTKRGEWSAVRPGRTLPRERPDPIFKEAAWASGPVRTGGKCPHRYSIPDRPDRSQSLNRLTYPAHSASSYLIKNTTIRRATWSKISQLNAVAHSATVISYQDVVA